MIAKRPIKVKAGVEIVDFTIIINIIAIILSPIIAVVIGQKLHDKSALRKDKMDIFKCLMEGRSEYTNRFFKHKKTDDDAFNEINRNINLIPIVFAGKKCKDVISKYNEICSATENVIKRVNSGAFLPEDAGKCLEAYKALLTAIGNNLDYKDVRTFEYELDGKLHGSTNKPN